MVSVFTANVTSRARGAWFCGALALVGCSTDKAPSHEAADASKPSPEAGPDSATKSGVTPAPDGAPYQTLAEWNLFTDAPKQIPAAGVVPYDVNSQLFADYATKYRFIYLPPGEKIGYSATDTWNFPVGTILVKTFSYLVDARDPSKGQRLLETRLLIHESDGWTPHTYVWNDAQTSAVLTRAGTTVANQAFIDASGKSRTNNYSVPSENDCRNCHGKLGLTNTLGGRTLQLDRDHDYGAGPENQIDHLTKLGWFDTTPEPESARVHLVDPLGTAPVYDRVRSYFVGNCAHCHQPGKYEASGSGLWLDYASTDPNESPLNIGICKPPSAAGGATCGRELDVVPGNPDDSIMICRMGSTSAKVKMPPVGRNMVHTEGVALLREWISGLPGNGCNGVEPPPHDGGAPTTPDAGTADASDAAAH